MMTLFFIPEAIPIRLRSLLLDQLALAIVATLETNAGVRILAGFKEI